MITYLRLTGVPFLGICMNTQMDYFTVTVFVPDHLLNTLLRRDIGV